MILSGCGQEKATQTPKAQRPELRGNTSTAGLVRFVYEQANNPSVPDIDQLLSAAEYSLGNEQRHAKRDDFRLEPSCSLRTITGTDNEAVAEGGCDNLCPEGGPPVTAYFGIRDGKIITIRREIYEC